MRKLFDLQRTFGIMALGAGLLAGSAAACSGGDDAAPVLAAGCPDDLEFFQANVYEPILGKKCVLCHSQGGLAQGTRMVLQQGSDEASLQANFETMKQVAALDGGGAPLLLLKPSGQHEAGHTGGTLFERGSPQYQAMETFVDRVTKGKGCDVAVANCEAPTPGPRMLRRLSREEYDATVSDLFNIASTWGATFSPDTVVNGFDNNAAALRVSPLLADQTRRAAEEIAAKVMETPEAILPCDAATGDAACAADLIADLGKRAFRRPLSDADVARYQGLYDAVAAEDGFLVAVETVIAALLQSPHFLYRTELGEADAAAGEITLTQHEIASELSYFLWGTMPDDELMAKADAGELSTPEQIEAQARRLLADPRSDAALDRFVAQWLDVERLGVVPKDAMAFPEFTLETRAAMSEETRRFVRHVVREGEGTLTELLNAKYSFASPELAAFYGLPAGEVGADGMVRLDLTGTPRAGLLTQGSVLATHAKPNNSSPIHRGKVVRERLLCQPLPPPPPGVNAQPPAMDPTKTTRERYTQHSSDPACASCHRLVDPIGFGFEHFDGIGRYRADEGGLPIDATGEILSTEQTNTTFEGTEALAQTLAQSPDVHACFSLQWLRFAYGVEEDATLSCTATSVAEGFAAGGLKVEDVILSLVRAPHFTRRAPDATDDGGSTPPDDSGSSSSSSSSSGGGDPPPPPPDDEDPPSTGVDVAVDDSNDWGAGYCANVIVTNSGSAAVTWTIELTVEGTVTDLWNATSEPAGDKTRFKGVDHNATLDPGEKADFGFCATR